MGVYLCAEFEFSSIILTGFRQGEEGGRGNLTPPPPQNEPLKSPSILGLNRKLLCLSFHFLYFLFFKLYPLNNRAPNIL